MRRRAYLPTPRLMLFSSFLPSFPWDSQAGSPRGILVFDIELVKIN